jgi:hypothetical protein
METCSTILIEEAVVFMRSTQKQMKMSALQAPLVFMDICSVSHWLTINAQEMITTHARQITVVAQTLNSVYLHLLETPANARLMQQIATAEMIQMQQMKRE